MDLDFVSVLKNASTSSQVGLEFIPSVALSHAPCNLINGIACLESDKNNDDSFIQSSLIISCGTNSSLGRTHLSQSGATMSTNIKN